MLKRLPDLKVVDQIPASSDRVFFGATVHLEDEKEVTHIYRIVGPDEFDREAHFISIDSPLARALLKRELGEEVQVTVPGGNNTYLITGITYDS